jgi:hypothetical protein
MDDRDRGVRDTRRLHLLHRAPVDFFLVDRPAEELLERPVLEREGGRCDAVATSSEVGLDMLATDSPSNYRHALRLEVSGEVVKGVEVDPGRLVGAGRVEVEAEALAQAGQRIRRVDDDHTHLLLVAL